MAIPALLGGCSIPSRELDSFVILFKISSSTVQAASTRARQNSSSALAPESSSPTSRMTRATPALCSSISPAIVFYVHCDVTNESHVECVINAAVILHRKLDIMFSNVGIYISRIALT
ncbi:momilactone A synthase isoform X1 [Canna indica]|uniref:Momilactone A synthase isoform X1 n=1 Tax=Canna indica TaxID=4628 RepID=A0AAQ3KMV7_9LILI|nr:momilactone A synthase isoform X1 [Canna indica]